MNIFRVSIAVLFVLWVLLKAGGMDNDADSILLSLIFICVLRIMQLIEKDER